MRVLVTGGAGFIGSNYVFHLLGQAGAEVTVLDKLTYAGNDNLRSVMKDITFVKGDICDEALAAKIMRDCDQVVHFAAESHVDRSISSPKPFVMSNVVGTWALLEAARVEGVERFVHISTDEVYGSREAGRFSETSRLEPSSPYSASKAGADEMVLAYGKTFGLPVVVTRSSNNYGPYQHPEKLIPKTVICAMGDRPIPVYGSGKNVRDWLFVQDNCAAIDLVRRAGSAGEVYNIGAQDERENLAVVRLVLELLNKPERLVRFVEDRKGHDFRYAISTERVRALGWKPGRRFEDGLQETIGWYERNRAWWKSLVEAER